MSDTRLVRLKNALWWWDNLDSQDWHNDQFVTLVEAAREHADQLENGALVIQRDENGRWPVSDIWSDDAVAVISRYLTIEEAALAALAPVEDQ